MWIGLLAALLLFIAVGVLIAAPLFDEDEPRAAFVDGGTPPTTEHDMEAMGGVEGNEAPERIPGVTIYEVPTRWHTDDPVDYAQTPPVGGDHNPIWQNCGFYDEAIRPEHAVHSLEHAVVWITYRPDLPADQLAGLRRLGEQEHLIISPWTDGELPAPIVLSAWGVQGMVDDVDDPLVDQFIKTYRNAMSAPEPNGPCDGGEDGPAPLR